MGVIFIKTVAIIPVRGGSKSIPLKNIKLINDRPLVFWTIDAAVNCSYIDEVYVSTDSNVIREVVEKYDNEKMKYKLHCIERSQLTATDTASTESVMLEFVEKVISDRIVLLQATSPLTDFKHLNEAFELLEKGGFDSIVTVVEQKRFMWTKDENNGGIPLNYHPSNRPRRQDFQGHFIENGAFYITQTERLINTEVRISGKIGMYEMPEETYFEIDEPSDWLIVEQLLKKKTLNFAERLKNIKLFATDCDGVLTDAGMYYTVEGEAMKKFNTKDGMGFALLDDLGIHTAILTGENSNIVKKRADKLNIKNVYLGCKNKVGAMEELLAKYNLTFEEVAYIGDDINDLPLLQKVGFSFSVNDAIDEIKDAAVYVTRRNGGDGAVREAIDLIVKSKE